MRRFESRGRRPAPASAQEISNKRRRMAAYDYTRNLLASFNTGTDNKSALLEGTGNCTDRRCGMVWRWVSLLERFGGLQFFCSARKDRHSGVC